MNPLDVVGITDLEARLYRHLLGRPATSVAELATALAIPRGHVTRDIRSLLDKGLIAKEASTPARYIAHDPRLALGMLVGRGEDALLSARRFTAEMASEFRATLASRDHTAAIEVVTGREQIMAREAQLIRTARTHIRAFDKPPYHDPEDSNQEELDFLARGGTVRAVYEAVALDVTGRQSNLQQWITSGEDARVAPSLPTKIVILDDDSAIMPLRGATPDSPSHSFVIIHQSSMLEGFIRMFELIWDQAFNIGNHGADSSPATLDGLTARDQRILALMAGGLPDEAISRQLGISSRTLTRDLHTLMDRVGATTRFQFGITARHRGWL